MSEPANGTPSTVLKVLKQRVSRDLRRRKRGARTRQLCLPFAENGQDAKRFWQPRFYDFNVFTEKKKREKLEYMHANPVTRDWCEIPKIAVEQFFRVCEERKGVAPDRHDIRKTSEKEHPQRTPKPTRNIDVWGTHLRLSGHVRATRPK